MASPKSPVVSCSYVPWQWEGPPWPPAVTQKAAAENRKTRDSCDKPSAFTRADKAGGRLSSSFPPQLYVAFLFFFFFFLPQTALNFLLDLVSSVEKCCPEGPAEILSGPASLKKANNLFAHQEWKKCFHAPEVTEHTLSKMNRFLLSGIVFSNWENKALNIQ